MLVEACNRGERRAFEHLLSRHHRPVYNYMVWQVGDGSVVDRLLHEVFTRVFEEARRDGHKTSFTTLLYIAARDLCATGTRRKTSISGAAGSQEERLLAAIEELEDEQREVFFLREYLNLPFIQIAEIVGCDCCLVKNRMRAALERLRREVA